MLPGNFVRIRIETGIDKQALLVPDSALGELQGNRTVLVADVSNHVQERTVQLGSERNGWTVITSGLQPDDRVIVNGMQLAKAGQLVRPHLVSVAAARNDGTRR